MFNAFSTEPIVSPIAGPAANLSVSAIVLAGGLSSRMGQDKALLPIDGIPLLLRVCQAAKSCTDQIYVVTPWIDRYRPLLQGVGVQLIQESAASDELPHGPIVGFQQGLAQIQTDWVLLLACDLPQLRGDILQSWMQSLPHVPPDTIACLSKNPRGWWEPLCGFYHRRCESALANFVAEGGRSFQRWLDQNPVVELPLDDPQMLFNCNTPDDLDASSTFPQSN